MLVLALGKATKINREGERHEVEVQQPPDDAAVRAAIASFIGTFLQRPPAFSAVKVGGRRAYKMARKGNAPKMAERPVTVHEIEMLRYEWPHADIAIHCAKGFYVRSLARDLGEKLGTGGHCASIRRTAVGPFTLAMATPLDDVLEPVTAEHLMVVDEALALVARG